MVGFADGEAIAQKGTDRIGNRHRQLGQGNGLVLGHGGGPAEGRPVVVALDDHDTRLETETGDLSLRRPIADVGAGPDPTFARIRLDHGDGGRGVVVELVGILLIRRAHARPVGEVRAGRAGIHRAGQVEVGEIPADQVAERPKAQDGFVAALAGVVPHVGQAGGEQVPDQDAGGVVRASIGHRDRELNLIPLVRVRVVGDLGHLQIGLRVLHGGVQHGALGGDRPLLAREVHLIDFRDRDDHHPVVVQTPIDPALHEARNVNEEDTDRVGRERAVDGTGIVVFGGVPPVGGLLVPRRRHAVDLDGGAGRAGVGDE